MTKEIKTSTEGIDQNSVPFAYKLFTDQSATAQCAKCEKWEDIPAGAPVFRKQKPFENYTCKACFTGAKTGDRKAERSEIQNSIANGQAWNLAAQFVQPFHYEQRQYAISKEEQADPVFVAYCKTFMPTETNEMLTVLHDYFYRRLTGQDLPATTAPDGPKVEEQKPIQK